MARPRRADDRRRGTLHAAKKIEFDSGIASARNAEVLEQALQRDAVNDSDLLHRPHPRRPHRAR